MVGMSLSDHCDSFSEHISLLRTLGERCCSSNGVSRNMRDRSSIEFENDKEGRFDFEWVATH